MRTPTSRMIRFSSVVYVVHTYERSKQPSFTPVVLGRERRATDCIARSSSVDWRARVWCAKPHWKKQLTRKTFKNTK